MTGAAVTRHLVSKRQGYTACGLRIERPSLTDGGRRAVTNRPAYVTCGRCKRAIEMADREVKEQQKPRR